MNISERGKFSRTKRALTATVGAGLALSLASGCASGKEGNGQSATLSSGPTTSSQPNTEGGNYKFEVHKLSSHELLFQAEAPYKPIDVPAHPDRIDTNNKAVKGIIQTLSELGCEPDITPPVQVFTMVDINQDGRHDSLKVKVIPHTCVFPEPI